MTPAYAYTSARQIWHTFDDILDSRNSTPNFALATHSSSLVLIRHHLKENRPEQSPSPDLRSTACYITGRGDPCVCAGTYTLSYSITLPSVFGDPHYPNGETSRQ